MYRRKSDEEFRLEAQRLIEKFIARSRRKPVQVPPEDMDELMRQLVEAIEQRREEIHDPNDLAWDTYYYRWIVEDR